MPTPEEFAALQRALAEAAEQLTSVKGELRVVRTERDLLQEQLNRFKRKLFDAKSEAAASVQQKDMFFYRDFLRNSSNGANRSFLDDGLSSAFGVK